MALQGSFTQHKVFFSHLFQGAPILSREKKKGNVIYVISYIYMQFLSDLSPNPGKKAAQLALPPLERMN